MTPAAYERRAELTDALGAVYARIAAACRAVGRDPAEVGLLAVAKTWPASDVIHLMGLGVRDIGENRAQELATKRAEVAALVAVSAESPAPSWHFVGRLQRNKATKVGSIARTVHTVDRVAVLAGLAAGASTAGHQVDVFVQVSLDPVPAAARGGAPPDTVPALGDAVAATGGLRLVGVMGVAPLGADARAAFGRLRAVGERLRASHPGAAAVSAGMTGDLEAAVAEGATLVRVGTAVFGRRATAARTPD